MELLIKFGNYSLVETENGIEVDLRKETTVYLQGKWKIIDSVK
ncbi:hypothetical protein [Enterococcus faecalis]